MRGTLRERFEDKVERIPFHTCWEWVGARCGGGYGRTADGGKNGRSLIAHRVSYELYIGPIPDGLEIDHLCFNRGCVNPDHLEAVTSQVNNRRAAEKRSPQSSFRCGHPFESSNWYMRANGTRFCRQCHLDSCRRRYRRRHAA